MNSLIIAIHLVKRLLYTKKDAFLFLFIPSLIISGIVFFNLKDSNFRVYSIDYVNLDKGNLGFELIKSLERLPNIEMKETTTVNELQVKVVNQKTSAAFVIPEDYSDKVKHGETVEVPFLQLGRNAVNLSVQFAVDQITADWVKLKGGDLDEEQIFIQSINSRFIETKQSGEVLFINPNPKLREVDGLMLLFVMGIISNTVVYIMEDRKSGTLRRMFVAPLHSWEIVIGNFLGVVFIGTIQILLILGITRWVLGFTYGIPFASHFLVLELFLLAAVGVASATIGLLKSSQYLYSIQLLVIIPTCMIGGCFWSVNDMPEWMQKVSNFVPQSWAIDALKQLKDGASLGEVGYHLSIIFLFALVLLSFSSYLFNPSSRTSD